MDEEAAKERLSDFLKIFLREKKGSKELNDLSEGETVSLCVDLEWVAKVDRDLAAQIQLNTRHYNRQAARIIEEQTKAPNLPYFFFTNNKQVLLQQYKIADMIRRRQRNLTDQDKEEEEQDKEEVDEETEEDDEEAEEDETDKTEDMGGSIIRQARRQAEMLGFDQETGLQLDEKVSKKEDLSDDKLMKEIDEFLNDENRDNLDNDEHLKQLLILSDKADMIHHPSAKKRRQQMIKVEIQKLRRKISIDKLAKKESKSEEPEESEDVKKKPAKKKTTEKKRKREESSEEDGKEETKKESKKKRKTEVVEDTEEDEKSKKKAEKGPTKTGGVNRRNAILFTRKKAAQSEEKPGKSEDGDKDSSRRRRSQEENEEPERDEFEFNDLEEAAVPPPKSPRGLKKKNGKAGKGRARLDRTEQESGGKGAVMDDSLFQTYRQGGALDTDTDTGKVSASPGWCSSQ